MSSKVIHLRLVKPMMLEDLCTWHLRKYLFIHLYNYTEVCAFMCIHVTDVYACVCVCVWGKLLHLHMQCLYMCKYIKFMYLFVSKDHSQMESPRDFIFCQDINLTSGSNTDSAKLIGDHLVEKSAISGQSE